MDKRVGPRIRVMVEREEDLDDEFDNKPSLCKRKDFLEIEEEAKSHPNRTYYYRKYQDQDKLIETCTRKLKVIGTDNLRILLVSFYFLRGALKLIYRCFFLANAILGRDEKH